MTILLEIGKINLLLEAKPWWGELPSVSTWVPFPLKAVALPFGPLVIMMPLRNLQLPWLPAISGAGLGVDFDLLETSLSKVRLLAHSSQNRKL